MSQQPTKPRRPGGQKGNKNAAKPVERRRVYVGGRVLPGTAAYITAKTTENHSTGQVLDDLVSLATATTTSLQRPS